MKILLVDDSESIRHIIRSWLNREGDFTFLEAYDGVPALELLAANPDIALLITDYNMPVMDGVELTRRAHEIMPHLPIVMCSIESDTAIVRKAALAGIQSYLAKPFTVDVFLKKIRPILAECRSVQGGA